MAIQFDKLPTSNPFSAQKPDVYKAKIVQAEMKKKKDGTSTYLNLKYALTDHAGNACGSIFDIMSESESPVVQYKISRFIQACGIPLQGSMELSDIGKLVLNKDIVVDVNHDKSEPPRAQVDLFTREAYYPIGQFEEIYKLAHAEDEEAEKPAAESFINVPDNTSEEVEY